MKETKRLGALLLVGLLLPLAAGSASGQGGGGIATVHLADGTSLPIRSWTLSYEFIAWPKGTPQFQGQTKSRLAPEIWVKKDTHPVAGHALEIVYGKPKASGGAVVKELGLIGAGQKRRKLKTEAPHRDLLLPDGDKNMLVMPRSLDLKGETLTGTKRSFCLLSYTALVECSAEPTEQVTKIEFQ